MVDKLPVKSAKNVAAIFMGCLERARASKIVCRQAQPYGDITITRYDNILDDPM